MIDKEKVDYDFIERLYSDWRNACYRARYSGDYDNNEVNQKKNEIKRKITPYHFLKYSAIPSDPFEKFRNIFELSDLFDVLQQMKENGEKLEVLKKRLFIRNNKDIIEMNEISKRDIDSEISNIFVMFTPESNLILNGDMKSIGKKFTNSHFELDIKQLEKIMENPKDYKEIPLRLDIENVGQLPLEKLERIEKYFDIESIRINDKSTHNQGQKIPLKLEVYKEIRKVIDEEILKKIYINENSKKFNIDYHITVQIINIIAQRMKYDYEAVKKGDDSIEFSYASSMVSLLTGKTICKGDQIVLKNVLSCVGIGCECVHGDINSGNIQGKHAWNQVKLGDSWYNVDLTSARENICNGKTSGDLFVSDNHFHGSRRRITYDKGNVHNGHNLEVSVIIGGHTQQNSSKCKKCDYDISPYLTQSIISKSKKYEEDYKKNGNSPEYKGFVPYIGTRIEKMRSCYKDVDEIEY